MTYRIAIVMTCFNRSEKTKKCLVSLESQVIADHVTLQYYICDDGSTDNTVECIKQLIPKAIVIPGGNLYWAKGMHVAMHTAIQDKNDFYLMVNDDVEFYNTALQTMIDSYKETKKVSGVVGATVSLNEKEMTYGGGDIL